MEDSKKKILFLPGLAADSRLFHYQLENIDQAVVPQWLSPEPNEPLTEYAERWSRSIDFQAGDFLAGMSFGGQVALELAKHLPASAVFLISANRRASEITDSFRLQQKVLGGVPSSMVKAGLKTIGINAMSAGEKLDDFCLGLLHEMVEDLDVAFLKWAAKAAAEWSYEFKESDFAMPIHQIHGEHDRFIHLSDRGEVKTLYGAAHLINYSHHKELNSWLQERMQVSI